MIQIVIAEITLGHHPAFLIKLESAIGTSPFTIVTAHTTVRIDQDDPTLSLGKRPGWAHFHANRSLAVHACHGEKIGEGSIDPGFPSLHPFAATDLNHPSPKDSNGKLILILACDLTGFASCTRS